MKKIFVLLSVMLVFCIAFTAAFAQEEPKHGGTLRVALNDLTHLDANSISADNEVYPLFYETLFEFDENWDPVGVLVESYEVSEDGKEHIWHIRPNVKFTDGTVCDAEAIKWNLDRKIELDLPFASNIPWDSIEVLDENTIKVTLTNHYLPIYHYLSSQTFSIYSPTFVQCHTDEDLKNQAVGTGPYIIDEYTPGDHMTLVPNHEWWAGEPNLDKVEIFFVSDPNTRIMMFESGEVDLIKELNVSDLDYFASMNDPMIVTANKPAGRTFQINFHTQRPPFDNREVRRALNYAIDKEGMDLSIFNGQYNWATDIVAVTEDVNGYTYHEPYPYDPELAKKMLDEQGLIDTDGDGYREFNGEPLEVILVTRKGQRPGDIELSEQTQAQFAEVGIKVKIDIYDSATYFTYLNQPMETAPFYHMSNQSNGNFTGDYEYSMTQFFSCKSWPGVLFNYSHYCNEEVEALYEEAKLATTYEERNALYAQASQIIWDDAPALWMFETANTAVMNGNLRGVYSDGAHMIWQIRYAWFEN